MDHAVIIDGANPRTPRERCIRLHDWFEGMDDSPGHRKVVKSFLFDFENGTDDAPGTGGEWNEVEDDLISCINVKLPDGWVCTVGDPDPGDVLIQPIDEVGD